MELSHADITQIALALRHRIVSMEQALDAERDPDAREDLAAELAHVRGLIPRVEAERPAAQQRFVNRAI